MWSTAVADQDTQQDYSQDSTVSTTLVKRSVILYREAPTTNVEAFAGSGRLILITYGKPQLVWVRWYIEPIIGKHLSELKIDIGHQG